MKLITILTFFLLLQACATHKSRRIVDLNTVKIVGGVYENLSWEDDLEFSRLSFYQDATMVNELLVTELNQGSSFYNWLGADSSVVKKCEKFMVALIYADINSKHNSQYLISQLEHNGMKEMALLDFSHHFKAHQNAQDWNLTKHKVIGLCRTSQVKSNIAINLPGFKTQILK